MPTIQKQAERRRSKGGGSGLEKSVYPLKSPPIHPFANPPGITPPGLYWHELESTFN